MEKIKNDSYLVLLNLTSILLRIIKNNFLEIILLTLIIFTSCNITEPKLIDYHNKILFTSSRSGKEQLYMMNPNGTDIVQITSGQYWHNNGRWSPDASKIVCNTEEGTTTAGIEMAVFNSEGNNRIFLGWGNQMSWTPDGSKIIFSYLQGAEVGIISYKLYSIDYDGKNRIVISDKYAGGQAISPDGSKIIFPFNEDSLFGVVILNFPQFDNPLFIYTGSTGAYDLNWSPEGKEIIFSRRETSSELNSIFIMNSDGTNISKIINNKSSLSYKYPFFSSDANRIIFLGISLDGTQKSYLFTANKDGTDLHLVINDASVTSCDWSK